MGCKSHLISTLEKNPGFSTLVSQQPSEDVLVISENGLREPVFEALGVSPRDLSVACSDLICAQRHGSSRMEDA